MSDPLGREPRLNVPVVIPDGVRVGLAPIEGQIIIAMVDYPGGEDDVVYALYPETASAAAADLVRAVADLARIPARDDA